MAAAVTPLVSTSRLGTDPEPTIRSLYDDGDACLNDGCMQKPSNFSEPEYTVMIVHCEHDFIVADYLQLT
uniref:Uncharacterized protein n=1 Tax=Oryza nivara TaxID=4536 RepID=A0A0E0J144_ORYNI